MRQETTDLRTLFLENKASLQLWERENEGDNAERIARLKKNLKEAIQSELTPKQQTYLLKYFFEGATMEEIGAELGVNKSTVSRTVTRAKARLNKVLKYSM